MQTVGNILWLIFVGLWLAIGFVVAGIVMFILIITIPFGIQAFKMAGFALWPFGRHVEYTDRVTSPLQIIGNIIWIILAGLYLAVNCLVGGVILCITIIGIPFGIQSFKLIPVVLMPFGAVIVSDRATAAPAVA
ncbi:MAG TPA: YccF domain-containing protein [Acidimicrobiia bacterium]